MQVNDSSLPVPFICSHSMFQPWHFGHKDRGGTNRVRHAEHLEPISLRSTRNLVNELSLKGRVSKLLSPLKNRKCAGAARAAQVMSRSDT